MARYRSDEGLSELAKGLIEAHHPQLAILKIGYIFRDEAATSAGKIIAGKCIKVDDRNRTFHGLDILIEIGKDVWDEATPQFRNALMDHELSHIVVRLGEEGDPEMDEKTLRVKTYLRHHDSEEFAPVLERHGAYHEDLRDFLLRFQGERAAAKRSSEPGMTGAENFDDDARDV